MMRGDDTRVLLGKSRRKIKAQTERVTEPRHHQPPTPPSHESHTILTSPSCCFLPFRAHPPVGDERIEQHLKQRKLLLPRSRVLPHTFEIPTTRRLDQINHELLPHSFETSYQHGGVRTRRPPYLSDRILPDSEKSATDCPAAVDGGFVAGTIRHQQRPLQLCAAARDPYTVRHSLYPLSCMGQRLQQEAEACTLAGQQKGQLQLLHHRSQCSARTLQLRDLCGDVPRYLKDIARLGRRIGRTVESEDRGCALQTPRTERFRRCSDVQHYRQHLGSQELTHQAWDGRRT